MIQTIGTWIVSQMQSNLDKCRQHQLVGLSKLQVQESRQIQTIGANVDSSGKIQTMIIISSQIQTNLDKFRQVHPSQNYSLLQCIADLDKLRQCRQIQTNLDRDSQIQTNIDRYNDQCDLFKSTVMQANTTNMHNDTQIQTNLDKSRQD